MITTGGLSAGVIDFDTDPATKIVLGIFDDFWQIGNNCDHIHFCA